MVVKSMRTIRPFWQPTSAIAPVCGQLARAVIDPSKMHDSTPSSPLPSPSAFPEQGEGVRERVRTILVATRRQQNERTC
jgi:hypothetical protein